MKFKRKHLNKKIDPSPNEISLISWLEEAQIHSSIYRVFICADFWDGIANKGKIEYLLQGKLFIAKGGLFDVSILLNSGIVKDYRLRERPTITYRG